MYLSEDLDRTLKRYIGKFVSIFTFGGHRFVGRLESILDGGFCLSNAERLDDYDESNWFSSMRDNERMNASSGNGRETIVLFPQVVCISCPDENLPPILKVAEGKDTDEFELSDQVSKGLVDDGLSVELRMGSELFQQLCGKGPHVRHAIAKVRQELSDDFGFSFPRIHADESSGIEPHKCVIEWNGCELEAMRFPIDTELLLIDSADEHVYDGTYCKDPVWFSPACWLDESQCAQLRVDGMDVKSLPEMFVAFVASTLRAHCEHFYSFDHTSKLISSLRKTSPALVEETVERTTSLLSLHSVLNQLIKERCTIRPLKQILTATGLRWDSSDEPIKQLSQCRLAISKWLVNKYRHETGQIRTIQLPKLMEEKLASKADVKQCEKIIERLCHVHRQADQARGKTCLAVSSDNLHAIASRLVVQLPNLFVVSHAEIDAAKATPWVFPWPKSRGKASVGKQAGGRRKVAK